jgi:hypothetical protein
VRGAILKIDAEALREINECSEGALGWGDWCGFLSYSLQCEKKEQAASRQVTQCELQIQIHGVTIPLPSTTVKIWSTAGIRISSFAPLGQCISTLSTLVEVPSPK